MSKKKRTVMIRPKHLAIAVALAFPVLTAAGARDLDFTRIAPPPAVDGVLPDDETTEPEFNPDAADPDPAPFSEPDYNSPETQQALQGYRSVDPDNKIPKALRDKALAYYHANLASIKNKNYLSVIDFSAHSSAARFFIIRMADGSVQAIHVAHGSGSDPDNTGFARYFSNVSGSKKTSLGFYKVSETYYGDHGLSARMDGLSSTNSNVRGRSIVIHGAAYVHESNEQPGRSWGCFTLAESVNDVTVYRLNGGSIIYAGLSRT